MNVIKKATHRIELSDLPRRLGQHAAEQLFDQAPPEKRDQSAAVGTHVRRARNVIKRQEDGAVQLIFPRDFAETGDLVSVVVVMTLADLQAIVKAASNRSAT